MARAPASGLCLLALSACQAVFGLDETDPQGAATGAAGAPGASSAQSGGATGGTSGSSGSAGAMVTASAGGMGQAGSFNGEGCAPDEPGDELLGYGDLEQGVTAGGDAAWDTFESSLEDETRYVHQGANAALLCAGNNTGNQDYFSAFIDVGAAEPLKPGDTFVASACLSARPGSTPPTYVMLRLREQGSSQEIDTDTPQLPPPATYERIVTPPMTVMDPDNTKLTFHVLGWDMSDEVCFVFDSAHVVRLPTD